MTTHQEQHAYSVSRLTTRQEEQWQKAGALESSVMHFRRSLAANEEQQGLQGALVQDTIRDMQQQRAAVTYLRTENDRLHRCFEDLAKSTKRMHCEVAVHSERQEELQSAVAAAHQQQSAATEEQATVLRRLLATRQEGELPSSKPQSPRNAWEAVWRRELELLRTEQQAALADQVRLLKREFESAYRAEQLAEAATSRQAALERGMAEVKQKMDALVTSYADRTSAEALEQSQCMALTLESQSAACHESVIELRESLLQELANADSSRNMEQRCLESTEALRTECMTCVHEVIAQREAVAHTKVRAKAERDECLKLGKSHACLAKEVADVGCFVSENCMAMRKNLDTETEARMREQSTLRAELTAAIAVIKAQFDEWMDVVTGMKAEIAELSRSLYIERENRLRESSESRTELAAVLETAHRELNRNRAELQSEFSLPEAVGGTDAELLTPTGGLGVESRLADWLQTTADSTVNTAMICKLVLEVFNHCDLLSNRLVSNYQECQLESRTALELIEPKLHRFDEWHREWEAHMPDVKKLLEVVRPSAEPGFDSSVAPGTPQSAVRADDAEIAAAVTWKELDAAIAGVRNRDDCRLSEVTEDLARLMSRVDGIERQLVGTAEATSGDGASNGRLEARRSVLKAMESMEAAAERIAREAAAEEPSVQSSREWDA